MLLIVVSVQFKPPEISVVQLEDLIDSTSTISRGRKRVRNVNNLKRNLKKTRRKSGTEILVVQERLTLQRSCNLLSIHAAINVAKMQLKTDREKMFNNFWQLSDWQHYISFILSSVSEIRVKRKKKDASKHKQSTYIFTLLHYIVCRYFFGNL